MSKKVAYYNRSSVLTPDLIFGDNYYDDWDANDLLAILSDTDPVTTWTSKGLNGAAFTQTNAAYKPVFKEDAIHGFPSVTADGTSEWMHVLSSKGMYNFLHQNKGAIIAIFKNPDTNSNLWPIIGNTGNSARVGFVTGSKNSIASPFTIDEGAYNGSPGNKVASNSAQNIDTSFDKWYSVIFCHDLVNPIASERMLINLNGSVNYENNTSTLSPSIADAYGNLSLFIFPDKPGYYFEGEISRLIIIDDLPTQNQIDQINNYLKVTYGSFPS